MAEGRCGWLVGPDTANGLHPTVSSSALDLHHRGPHHFSDCRPRRHTFQINPRESGFERGSENAFRVEGLKHIHLVDRTNKTPSSSETCHWNLRNVPMKCEGIMSLFPLGEDHTRLLSGANITRYLYSCYRKYISVARDRLYFDFKTKLVFWRSHFLWLYGTCTYNKNQSLFILLAISTKFDDSGLFKIL